MARILTFTDAERQVWADLFSCFMLGERFLPGARSIRAAARIYEGFETLAVGQESKRLKDEGGNLTLEDGDFDVLKETVNTVLLMERNLPGLSGQPRPVPAVRALAVLEYLARAEDLLR